MRILSIDQADISVYCPPMKIEPAGRGLRRTADEPMRALIGFSDGENISIPDVWIPPTWVRRIHALFWMVDACTGENTGTGNEYLSIYLPAESTVWRWSVFTMVALSIVAPVTLDRSKGESWQGSVVFPDCKIDLATMTAEAVTATGLLRKVG